MKNTLNLSLILLLCFFASISTAQNEERSAVIIEKGQELANDQKYEQALLEFRKVQRNDSNYVLAGLNELNALLQLEKNEEGLKLCDHLLKQKTNFSPNIMVFKGDFYDNLGKATEAEAMFTQVVKEYPLYHAAYYEHAILLIRKKQYDKAYERLIQTIKINPFHALSHYQMGLMAYRNNNISAAMLALQFYLICDPTSERSKKLIPDLERIVKTELEFDSVTHINVFVNQNDFSELESLIRSKVALSKKFKAKTKLPYDFTKQSQLLIDNIANYTDVKGFYNEFYGTFFAALNTEKHFEPFSYYILSGLGIADIDNWRKKNADNSNKFELWTYNYLCRKMGSFPEDLNGKTETVPHWYQNSLIYGAGNRDANNLDQGYWNFYFNNGIKKSEGTFVNDKKDGVWKYYYADGIIKEQINYQNGEETNYSSYYSNGNLKVQITLDKGKIVGEKKVYYSNGNMAYTSTYKDNIENGAEIHYYRNGVLRYKINNVNALIVGELIECFKNGKIYQKVNFVDGKREGVARTYFNNTDNSLASEGTYTKGKKTGEWKEYYKVGKVYKISHYNAEGELEGNLKEYYSNGNLQLDEEYTSNKLTGNSKMYNEDASLWQEFVYKKNRLIEYRAFKNDGTKLCDNKINGKNFKLVLYHPNGNKRREGVVSDGLLQGSWKDYNLFGILTTESIYEQGKYNETYTDFYPNGKVKRTRTYNMGDETGKYRSYFINGQVEAEGWMQEGETQGYWNYYYIDGTPLSKVHYVGGEREGWCEYYDVAGKLESENLYREYCLVKAVYHDTLGAVSQMYDLPGGNGLLQKKNADGVVLFKKNFVKDFADGIAESYFPNGKVETSISFANGMKEGRSVEYNALGKLVTDVTYFSDEKNGKEKSYDFEGQLENEYIYENGDFNGKCLNYYPGGKLEKDIVYDYGDAEGPSNLYDEAGELIYARNFHNDLLVSYSYQLPTGQMHAPMVLPNGESTLDCFYKNGQKSLQVTYLNGDLHGKRILYHSNGKLKAEGTLYYDQYNGESKEYYPSGTLKNVESFLYGKRHGATKTYYENGKLSSELIYKNSKLHGWVKYYDKTGKLLTAVLYYDGDPIKIQ